MRLQKRIISMILAVIITAATTGILSIGVTNPTELITNGDFEAGAEGWSVIGTCQAFPTTDYAHNGAKSMMIFPWQQGVETDVSLESGKEYKLSFWRYGSLSGSTVAVASSWSAYCSGGDILPIKYSTADEGWKYYEYTFTSTKSGTATIYVGNEFVNAKSYFDEFSLKEYSNEEQNTDKDELIADSGFEKEFVNSSDIAKGWVLRFGASLSTTSYQSGKQSLCLDESATGVVTEFPVVTGTSYSLVFYHKGGAGATVDIASTDANHNTTPDVLKKVTVKNDSLYTKYSADFTATITGNVVLYIENSTATSKSYFDNVSIKIKKIVSDNEYITNGGFETGDLTGWSKIAGDSSVSKNYRNSGEYALYMNPWIMGDSTVVALEKDTSYDLVFYHYGLASGATVAIASSWSSYTTSPDILTKKVIGSDAEWKKYVYTFTSPITGSATIYIDNQVNAPAYFDDFSLKEHDSSIEEEPGEQEQIDEDEIIADSGFEKPFTNDDTKGWQMISNSRLVGTNCFEGFQALELQSWSQGVHTSFNLEKDKEYELTFYHKGVAGSVIDIATTWGAHSGTPDILQKTTIEADATYKKYTIIFVSSKTTLATLYIESQVGGLSYFDNVSLKFTPELSFGDGKISMEKSDSSSITVSWPAVTQRSGIAADVTYNVYASETLIAESSIENLSPIATLSGNEQLKAKVTNLNVGEERFFAVAALDKSGNKAFINIISPFRTRVDVNVVNNNFETGDFTGWNNVSGQSAFVQTYTVHGGDYALCLWPWATGVLSRPIAVNPSTKYVLSFYAYEPLGKLRCTVIENWDAVPMAKIQVSDHYEFKKYSTVFETDEDMFEFLLFFDNHDVNASGFVDDVYLAEIDNEDLYFDSNITVNNGAKFISINFAPAVSKNGPLTYEIYRSTEPLTVEKLKGLSPIQTLTDVDDIVDERDKDVKAYITYYYAVKAIDSLGDATYAFSDGAMKTSSNDVEIPDFVVGNSDQDNNSENNIGVSDEGEYEEFEEEFLGYTESDNDTDSIDDSYITDLGTHIEKRPVKKKHLKTSTKLIVHNYTVYVVLGIVSGIILLTGIVFTVLYTKGIIKKRKGVKKGEN